jgi:hypothetical protein
MRRVTFKMRISVESWEDSSTKFTLYKSNLFFFTILCVHKLFLFHLKKKLLSTCQGVCKVSLFSPHCPADAHIYLLWRVNLTRPAGWTRDKERTAHVREDALLRIDLLSKSRNLAYIGVSCVHAEMLLYRCESRLCRWNGLELLFCWRRLNRMHQRKISIAPPSPRKSEAQQVQNLVCRMRLPSGSLLSSAEASLAHEVFRVKIDCKNLSFPL